MKRNYKLLAATLAVVLALLVTACGSANMPGADNAQAGGSMANSSADEPDAASANGNAPNSAGNEFNFWDSMFKTDLDANAYLRKTIEMFEEQYPDLEFVLSTKGRPEQMYDYLTIAFSADDGPDAFGFSVSSQMSPLIESGKLRQLDDWFEENGWNETLDPVTLEMQDLLFDGHRYAVPIEHQVMGIYYRKDLYEQYGLEVPTTMEEFQNNLQVLKDNGVAAIGNPGKVPAATNRWFDGFLELQCGPELHDQLLNGTASIDCPEVVAALQDLKDLSAYFQDGHLSAEESEVYMLLYPGQAAHLYAATWQPDTFESQEQSVDDYGYFRFPGSERSNAFSYGVYVNAATQHMDAAQAYLDICADAQPYQTAFDEKNSIVGTRLEVFDASKLDALRAAVLEDKNNPNGAYMPSNEMSWPPRLTDELFEVLDKVMLDEITPADGAKQLDAMAQEIGFYK